MFKQYPDLYKEQIKIAKDLYKLTESHKLIGCSSPFQSGKSGVIAALSVLAQQDGIKTYVLSGVSDVKLRAQLENRLDPFPFAHVLDKYKDINHNMERGSLIVLDEAHFGTGDTALIAGIIDRAKKYKCTLVTLSATPFEILSDNIKAQFHLYFTQLSQLGARYRGISSFVSAGQVYNTGETQEEELDSLEDALVEFKKQKKHGYFLVRAVSKKIKKLIERYAINHPTLDFVYYDQQNQDWKPANLKMAPRKNTVVVVNQYFRCGNVLPSFSFIWGVFESSKQLDALFQGLIGRVCGYRDNKHIRVYANLNKCKFYAEYETTGVFNYKILADNPKYKLASRVQTTQERAPGVYTAKLISLEEYTELNKAKQIGATRSMERNKADLGRKQKEVYEYLTNGVVPVQGIGSALKPPVTALAIDTDINKSQKISTYKVGQRIKEITPHLGKYLLVTQVSRPPKHTKKRIKNTTNRSLYNNIKNK